jgi:hypothetical protein
MLRVPRLLHHLGQLLYMLLMLLVDAAHCLWLCLPLKRDADELLPIPGNHRHLHPVFVIQPLFERLERGSCTSALRINTAGSPIDCQKSKKA